MGVTASTFSSNRTMVDWRMRRARRFIFDENFLKVLSRQPSICTFFKFASTRHCVINFQKQVQCQVGLQCIGDPGVSCFVGRPASSCQLSLTSRAKPSCCLSGDKEHDYLSRAGAVAAAVAIRHSGVLKGSDTSEKDIFYKDHPTRFSSQLINLFWIFLDLLKDFILHSFCYFFLHKIKEFLL